MAIETPFDNMEKIIYVSTVIALLGLIFISFSEELSDSVNAVRNINNAITWTNGFAATLFTFTLDKIDGSTLAHYRARFKVLETTGIDQIYGNTTRISTTITWNGSRNISPF